MTPRWNIGGPEFGLCLMAFVLGLSNVAVAQPGDAAEPDTTSGSSNHTASKPAASAEASAEGGTAPAAAADNAAPRASATVAAKATAAATPEAQPAPAGGRRSRSKTYRIRVIPSRGYAA